MLTKSSPLNVIHCCLALLVIVRVGGTTAWAASGDRIVLNRVTILQPNAPPSYVAYGMEELRAYLKEHGTDCQLVPVATEIPIRGCFIVVGAQAAESLGFAVPDEKVLGIEGFSIQHRTDGERILISVAGRRPQGTKFGLIELIKSIRTDTKPPHLPLPLTGRSKPRFARRGMYAHLHWQYQHPYALRSWSEEDWKRYIDLLSYFGCNQLQCWPMAATCPVPLSDRDRAYLDKYRRVIKYAHNARGMEIWPGEAPNNVAETDGGQPIERRRYFDVEVKKNPAISAEFEAIMANRRAFYETVRNGDAYWIIDSDPGGWKGSPASEFVDILRGNRTLLDQHTDNGKDTKLVYWMWQGWGTDKSRSDNIRTTLIDMKNRLPEPWLLHACDPYHLELARDLGPEHKTVYFPYNSIEHEPSWPITALAFGLLRDVLRCIEPYPQIRGVQGNAQTPLVQLPNIYFFTQCLWDWRTLERDDEAIVRELARLLLPDLEHELSDAWLALPISDALKAGRAYAALESKHSKIGCGRVGPIGRFVVPDASQIVTDVLAIAKLHAAACTLADDWKGSTPNAEKVRRNLHTFLDAALTWFAHTGYERPVVFHPRTFGLDFLHVRSAMDTLLKKDASYATIFHETLNRLYPILSERYTDRRVHETLWRLAGEFYPNLIATDSLPPSEKPVPIVPAIEMVDIPGGTFKMGSPKDESDRFDDEGPVHEVTLSSYRLSKFEITNAQFRAFKPEHDPPSLMGQAFNKPDQPTVYVNWRDAQAFCKWLSTKTGRHYRLPTEAEWEFAARAHSTTPYPWGDSPRAACDFANVADQSASAIWHDWPTIRCNDGHAVTASVGSYATNAFGLCDMIGNVWEWCSDWYCPDYDARADKSDPKGPPTGAGPVIRGGSWSTGPRRIRSATRSHASLNDRHSRIGFRICESQQEQNREP